MSADRICWQPFVDWAHPHLKLRDFDGGWGWEDPCNIGMPYGKTLLAAWLYAYGLPNDDVRPVGAGLGSDMQFHGKIDYRRLVHYAGHGNTFHDDYEVNGDEDREKVSHYDGDIRLECPVFDNTGGVMDSPVFLAQTIVHEAWHAWQDKRDIHAWDKIDDDNHTKPQGDCTQKSCDLWYDHHPWRYSYGDLHQYNFSEVPTLYHSVYQVEVEYACDLALYFTDSTILPSVADSAQNTANARLRGAFVRDPGFRCDKPHMFSGAKVP